MIAVELIFEFLAREHHLIAVDDDHKVARIDIGSERGLVLAAKERRHLGSEAAKGDPRCIDNVPLSLTV